MKLENYSEYYVQGSDHYLIPKDTFLELFNEMVSLKEESEALLTLLNWAEECDFGFDNFRNDDVVNWKEFDKETKDSGYIESMIIYAKKYNEIQNLKEEDDK